MASLNKLAIRGIRSFDDKTISVIEFFTPVTVIVGHNGSGKTTIIECLKYATTGDQPPNTRGGAFIHDPKMANEKEVKAQVKLRFHAANGTRMLAVRNLSVTAKKTSGLTMKTLESILALADSNVEKGGKRGVISTKCAEMDAEIPQLLGVSKSVLENVIFCHQEDSYWPLAEPSILKKKFDDIFEASRYTKALDSIKSLRKDRIAELKAETERLNSLQKEKAAADKLKSRITDLSSSISGKEIEYEEKKKQYDAIVLANAKFIEQATAFRQIFMKVEALSQNKARLQADMDEAKLNLVEVVGTDEELEAKRRNFHEHLNVQKENKKQKQREMSDLEDNLVDIRKNHSNALQRHGHLQAAEEAQKVRITERENLIRTMSVTYEIKGYSTVKLEGDKVIEFLSKLDDVKRKRGSECERLEADSRRLTDEYNTKSRELSAELEKHKAQRKILREQITERSRQVSQTSRQLAMEKVSSVAAEIAAIKDEILDKTGRISRISKDIAAADYDKHMNEKQKDIKNLESERDDLNTEFRSLNSQADARAELGLKKKEVKTKTTEIKNALDIAAPKYKNIAKKDLSAATFAEDIERVARKREDELTELEKRVNAGNYALKEAEAQQDTMSTQLKAKRAEVIALDRRLEDECDYESLEAGIEIANQEVRHGKTMAGTIVGSSTVFEKLLDAGKKNHKCTACNRHLDEDEMVVFEAYLQEQMKKASPDQIKTNADETAAWEAELEKLQSLRPVLATRDQLKAKEIPTLEAEIKKKDVTISEASKSVEDLNEKLSDAKLAMQEVQSLRQTCELVLRLQKEKERAENDIAALEKRLANTGSTKSVDDVQQEIDRLSSSINDLGKERQNLMNERDRQNKLLQTLQGELHDMQLKERDLASILREKENMEENIAQWKKDIETYQENVKTVEALYLEAEAPRESMEETYQIQEKDIDVKIKKAQADSREINMSVDKLQQTQKAVEKYVTQRGEQQLRDCEASIRQLSTDIEQRSRDIEVIREAAAKIEKEINESGSREANLRDNLRVRRLYKQIQDTQTEIESHDLEEAHRARRQFEQKYESAKKQEDQLHTEYSHIAGEVSSQKSQLTIWNTDLKDYKDTQQNYTDQLIKVKMADMANNDLEKYAKALDNAIMKYHGLKMEEVNDTMKHLWNKTYQGTDIDGIRIRSDVEGAANKRSYNYRVVMTKDQVEMDMRGRCSAGQKMLASIIIRLALSDSFGQNCGILALDEPTNALDTENIDALAESLVDIINERKSHSNFQLIIITHDESFLRKLGQSNVMEYYWRVSRDARQKSQIERQLFR